MLTSNNTLKRTSAFPEKSEKRVNDEAGGKKVSTVFDTEQEIHVS